MQTTHGPPAPGAAPEYGFTHRDLRRALPPELFERRASLIARQLLTSIASTAAAYACMSLYSPWFTLPLYWTFLGFSLYGFLAIGHECAHGVFLPKRWQNDLLGSLCYLVAFMPYEGWKQTHLLHHRYVAHYDREEYFGMRREPSRKPLGRLVLALMRVAPPAGLFLAHMMYLLGTRAKVGVLWVDNLYCNRKLHRGGFNRRLAAWNLVSLAAVALALACLAVSEGPCFVARFLLVPMCMAGAVNLLIGYMQHRDDKDWVLGFEEGTWTRLRGDLQTVDRTYWPFDFLLHDAARHHVCHHLFPMMPHYQMPRAMEVLAPILGAHYRHDEESVFLQYHRALANSRRVHGEGTLRFSP